MDERKSTDKCERNFDASGLQGVRKEMVCRFVEDNRDARMRSWIHEMSSIEMMAR